MAIIPGGQQIRTSSSDVDLTPRGNSLVQAQNKVYTMDDIVETVNNGEASYKVLTGYWDFDGDDLEQDDPTITVLFNNTGETLAANRLSAGFYRFSTTGAGVTGTGYFTSTQVVSSGVDSRLLVHSVVESGGNVTGIDYFCYAPGTPATGADTNGERVYFELRVY